MDKSTGTVPVVLLWCIASDSILYLGHVIDSNGVRCDPAKVEKVKHWPTPCSRKDVRSFLGLASYYRRFIEGFAKIAHPLTQLTSELVEFLWSDEADKAFQTLKQRLSSAPIMALPNFGLPFILSCDASDFAVGAVLKQLDNDGRERPIAYFSRALTATEQAYSASERECLALISATKAFRPYLYGSRFTLFTDHSALTCLDNVKNPNGRLARWSMYLRDFDYEIKYKKGTSNGDADALSRRGSTVVLQALVEHGYSLFDPSLCQGSGSLSQFPATGTSVDLPSFIDHPYSMTCPKDAMSGRHRAKKDSEDHDGENLRREGRCSDVGDQVEGHSMLKIFSGRRNCAQARDVETHSLMKLGTQYGVLGVAGATTSVDAQVVSTALSHGDSAVSATSKKLRDEERALSHLLITECNSVVGQRSEGQCHPVSDPELQSREFLIKLSKGQRDANKEPAFSAIIRLLMSPDEKLTVLASAKFGSELSRRRKERLMQRRRDSILDRYKIGEEGVLLTKVMHKVTSQSYDDFERELWVICVPENLRTRVLVMAHDDKLAGHFGYHRTLARVKTQFYFPRMRDFVRRFVYSCVRCRQTKASTTKTAGLLKPLPVPEYERPFSRVCMDKFGPIKGSVNGYNYVFTAIDLCTKFAVAAPYATGTAKDAMNFFLYHVCTKFGFPELLITDRGSEFNGQDFVVPLSCTTVKMINSTARHPQTQGSVERLNGILSQYLNVYREAAGHSDWDEYVPFACYAYNTSRHQVTGFSPFFLMYGYDPALHHELRFQLPSYDSFDEMRQKVDLARRIAMEKQKAAKETDARSYNKKRCPVTLQKGDFVLLDTVKQDKDRSARLSDRRIGPFVVDRVYEDNTVLIRDREKQTLLVNAARLHKIERRPLSMQNPLADTMEETEPIEVLSQTGAPLLPFRWSKRLRREPKRLTMH